jgi:uncharacterized protein (DUF433 family)
MGDTGRDSGISSGRRLSRRAEDRWLRRLYLPTYTVALAAKLAQTHPRTVSGWYFGRLMPSGARTKRVLTERERGAPLSYLELVEVAFVATLRHMGLRLQRIRIAHDFLRTRFEVEYPFAQLKLKTDGAEVLKDLEAEQGKWVELMIVASRGGQLVWKEMIQDRIREFEYDRTYGWAIRWFPRGANGPVLVDPRVAFGAPVLREYGLPTWVVRDRYRAGESPKEIEEDFGVSLRAIRQALDFEGIRLAA